MPNRLANAASLYLRQHAENPVDWYPWGPEAHERALAENKPIFLSIGYSSCHWCHVMAHESFEDPEVGAALAADFISIKLDREEHPDVDELYMSATQLATGHGGWPLTVFLTPDLKPFFVGTYFPRHGRGEFPGFLTIVTSLAQAWKSQESEIRQRADEFAEAIDQVRERTLPPQRSRLDWPLTDSAVQALHDRFDRENGGYGSRPKFPPHSGIEFLLKYANSRPINSEVAESLRQEAAFQALLTLEKMALGGIHDHVGGGFHRYSTDERWHLPHFEKMLTDNAQLLVLYATASEMAGDERLRKLFAKTSEGIVRWVRDEMTADDGTFFTALDADSDGEEGRFYVWEASELRTWLGDAFDRFAAEFGIEDAGNYLDEATGAKTGLNVLSRHRLVGVDCEEELAVLARARAGRIRPQRDDKRLAGANGLMIGALAFAGAVSEAERAATRWQAVFARRGDLPRYLHDGGEFGTGYLDDYVYLAQGLLRLSYVTDSERWRTLAAQLMEVVETRFVDDRVGDYRLTPTSTVGAFAPMKPILDQAVPSANGVAAINWQQLGNPERAALLLRANLGWVEQMPHATETLLSGTLGHLLALGPDQTEVPRKSQEVKVWLTRQELEVEKDGYAHTAIRFDIPDGLHINSADPPAKWLFPTSVHIDNLLGEVGFPSAEDNRYSGELEVPVRFLPPPKTTEFEMVVRFQTCSDTECYPPQEARLRGVVLVPV